MNNDDLRELDLNLRRSYAEGLGISYNDLKKFDKFTSLYIKQKEELETLRTKFKLELFYKERNDAIREGKLFTENHLKESVKNQLEATTNYWKDKIKQKMEEVEEGFDKQYADIINDVLKQLL